MNVALSGDYLSLFSGVAGLDLGLRIACPSTRCVGYVEREFAACQILGARMEEGSIDAAPLFTDVRTFPSELYRGRVAGLIAGFPCPDYSVAGKRAGIVGKHGQLWDYLAISIRDLEPDWIVLENVPGIYVPHGGDAGAVLPAGLWFVLGDLAALGFDAEWICLRASDVGASHGRARWFCLAYRKGGRLGVVRESSRGNGFTDGSNASVADPSRHERSGSHGEAGTRRRVCETGDGMADAKSERSGAFRKDHGFGSPIDAGNNGESMANPSNGQLPIARRGPEGRDGVGSGSADVLADTERSRRPQAGSGRDIDAGRKPATGRGAVECHHCAGTGKFPNRNKCYCCDGRGWRDFGDVGNSDQPGLQGQIERGHSSDKRLAGTTGDSELADTGCERNQRRGEPRIVAGAGGQTETSEEERQRRWDAACDSLPLFAPGPSDPRWPAIIRYFPWLAPAISEEEAESTLRSLASGLADLVVHERTDALRAVGNGVCSLQAAFAITILARRINEYPAQGFRLESAAGKDSDLKGK